MNEIKENIVILSRYEYDSLKENLTKADEGLKKREKMYEIFENYFWDNLYQNSSFFFNDMRELNIKDYSYKELLSRVLEIGLTDIKYINKKLGEYKTKETVKGEGNE